VWLIHNDSRSAALPEILRKLNLIYECKFLLGYTYILVKNMNEIILNSNMMDFAAEHKPAVGGKDSQLGCEPACRQWSPESVPRRTSSICLPFLTF